MKTWQWIALGSTLLAVAGCRTDPAIAMLERDNRVKEDEIYRLRDQVQDLQEDLQHAKASTVSSSAAAAKTTITPPTTRPRDDFGPSLGSGGASLTVPPPKTKIEPPAPDGPEPPPIPLDIKIPSQPLPPGELPDLYKRHDQGDPSHGGSPAVTPPPGTSRWMRTPAARPIGDSVALVDSVKVAQITLHRTLTGGLSPSDQSGDEGLLVLVQPRDIQGNILDAPAEIGVVLLDPALTGEASRVARWDFNMKQTAELITSGQDRGIRLELPWPAAPPTHEKLTLFVRYTTRDGRKLQVEHPIRIVPPGSHAARWQPMHEAPASNYSTSSGDSSRGAYDSAEPDPTRTASRPSQSDLPRPVWSPDRAY